MKFAVRCEIKIKKIVSHYLINHLFLFIISIFIFIIRPHYKLTDTGVKVLYAPLIAFSGVKVLYAPLIAFSGVKELHAPLTEFIVNRDSICLLISEIYYTWQLIL